ncbi:MAG: VWA domain-containing protein [Elusimicrobia bacterium]|nr:VWA domain-containing protein [Elusimicrobiota bacterium]
MGLFQRPAFLLAALAWAGAATALYFRSEARRLGVLAAFGVPATLSRLVPADALERRKWKFVLQAAGVFFLLVAMAGPQWGVELVTNESAGIQAILAVDVSLSMLAEDVAPNRMAKAKSEMLQVIDGLKGQRLGVLAFAGHTQTVCPLTTDWDAVKSLLGSVEVGLVSQPGTAIGDAISTATKTLGRYPGHKALVLLTDGEDRKGDAVAAAREAAKAGVHIYVLGVGTVEGAPIPLKDINGRTTGYVKDSSGRAAVSRLGEASSIQLADAAKGAYYRTSADESEAQTVVKHILSLERSRVQSSSANRYRNRYRFPLAIALLLLLLELLIPEGALRARWPAGVAPAALRARLRSLAPLSVAAATLLSGCGRGGALVDLWKGTREYAAGEYGKSLERFQTARAKRPSDARPVFNSGDARYRLEQFDQAKEEFAAVGNDRSQADRTRRDAFYNLGNSHFRKDEFKEAVEAYKRCLLIDPKDEDCRFNLLKALQAQKQPPKKDKDKEKEKPQDKKDDKSNGGKEPDRPDKSRPQSAMSQEDAERLMRAIRERENSNRKNQAQKRGVKGEESGVDW